MSTSGVSDALAQIREMNDLIRDHDPCRGIIARHDVPWGKGYWYYDTKGRLLIYVNRGWLHDLPYRKASNVPVGRGLLPASLTGIPVFTEP